VRGNAAGGRASRPPGAWTVDVPVARRPTLHGGPVWLRTIRATPCLQCCCTTSLISQMHRTFFSNLPQDLGSSNPHNVEQM